MPIVPIVMGGGDYATLAPPHSVIDVNYFPYRFDYVSEEEKNPICSTKLIFFYVLYNFPLRTQTFTQ